MLPDKLRESNGERLFSGGLYHHKGCRKLVPTGHKSKDNRGYNPWPNQRQVDSKQGGQPARTVKLGGFVYFFRYTGKKSVHYPHGEREVKGGIDDDHCQPCVNKPKCKKFSEYSRCENSWLEHLADDDKKQEDHASGKSEPRRIVRGRKRNQQHKKCSEHRDDDSRQEILNKRCFWSCPHRDKVFPVPFLRKVCRVNRAYFCFGLYGSKEHRNIWQQEYE